MPIEIKVVLFQELSNIELYQILQLRTEVFVVEQDCVYQDMDDKDYESLHVVLLLDNNIAAYTRIYQSSKASHIGRVVVKKEHRKNDLGRLIMKESVDFCESEYGKQDIIISAQLYLLKFYSELGFSSEGEIYLEDGIKHIQMRYVF
ncbi:MAG: GNAT family N-acetyltransferase [Flavobacteriaceae bacterium]|nr:GNAT family N-acetyltransferase [Flavobacteriaceae bacterium]